MCHFRATAAAAAGRLHKIRFYQSNNVFVSLAMVVLHPNTNMDVLFGRNSTVTF